MFTYERAVKNGKIGIAKREGKLITCKGCLKQWIIRKDREHSGWCRRCKFEGKKNPQFGKVPYNKGKNSYNDSEYKKEYYRNKRLENRAKAVEYLGAKCAHCGIENIPLSCWDFHHFKDKIMPISQICVHKWKRIEEELKKCILLCVFCHRILHSKDC